MDVCFVNSFYPPWIGGAETYTHNIAMQLTRLGHNVIVFCADTPLKSGATTLHGVRVHRMKTLGLFYGVPISMFPQQILSEDVDVFHVNFPNPYFVSVIAAVSKIRRIPSVITWHNDLPPVSNSVRALVTAHDMFIAPTFLPNYKRIIATTRSYAQSSRVLRYFINKVVVIPDGVDIQRFNPKNPGEDVKSIHEIKDETIVLFVGALTRWHRYKGLDVLLEALPIVLRRRPKTKLLVVGEGDLKGSYIRTAEELGIANSVIFAGRVKDQDISKYYAACDLLVLPSKDRSEGFGLVLLEAMASGKPVIGSRVGGIPDVITHGKTGWLVNPKDPKELAEAILELLSNEGMREQMGREGRDFAEKHDWSVIAKKTEELYREVLATS